MGGTGADDIIADMLEAMIEESGRPGGRINWITRLEHRLRTQWGGERPYVAKRPSEQTTYRIAEVAEVAARTSVAEAIRQATVSYRSWYRRK